MQIINEVSVHEEIRARVSTLPLGKHPLHEDARARARKSRVNTRWYRIARVGERSKLMGQPAVAAY